ncbi:MAG: hypothetical protein IPM50_01510 [Acidobacteriota bacterium]|nr:MAG: hypothetical protein IPM50_01510 [Acidobacteriota bacterium]
MRGEAKRSQRVWDGEQEEWEDWDHVYFLRSSVTGGVVSEATKTGKKRYTYVAAGGGVVARQELTDTDTQIVGWQMTKGRLSEKDSLIQIAVRTFKP